jgi:hypothetical protein
MRDKVVLVLLILMSAIATWLFIQNIQLSKKLDQYTSAAEEEKIKTAIPPTKPANPGDVSPFDKPNNDPKANEFTPLGSKPLPATSMQFDKKTHDFGRIHEGDKVNTVFKFKNTGANPLVITSAIATCGCTVPTWSHQPLGAGQEGQMQVEFDSEGKSGEVTKTVNVTANTEPALTVIAIKAIIIPRDN